jgi:hypothetical protein
LICTLNRVYTHISHESGTLDVADTGIAQHLGLTQAQMASELGIRQQTSANGRRQYEPRGTSITLWAWWPSAAVRIWFEDGARPS